MNPPVMWPDEKHNDNVRAVMRLCNRARIIVCVAAAACTGGDVDGVESDFTNDPPVALLRTPVIAPANQPVPIDASASFDPNGDALSFVFEFTDGSEPQATSEPIVEHVFEGPSLYTVVVRVLDSFGGEGLATQDLTVRLEYPDPPDFCAFDADCVVGDECVDRVCFSVGGSVD